MAESGLPGARLNLRLIWTFAGAVGDVVQQPEPSMDRLEAVLDGWAALSVADAPGDEPAVILPGAAIAASGEVGAARSDGWDDEIAKLRRGAADPRWRVREVVAQALQRLLRADWRRTAQALRQWEEADSPLVVRAAVAGVAEPPLLRHADRAAALAIQRIALQSLRRFHPTAAVPTVGERHAKRSALP